MIKSKKNESSDQEVFSVIGGYGFYQKVVTLLIAIMNSNSAVTLMAMVFTGYTPNFRCSQLLENIQNLTIETEAISISYKHNETETCAIPDINRVCLTWEYDETYVKSNLVTEFNLFCNKKYLSALAKTVFLFGKIFGILLTAFFCDRFGRKKVFLLGFLVMSVAKIISAFTTHYWIYVCFRFILGACASLIFTTAFILSTELVDRKYIPWVGTLNNVAYSIGGLVVTLLAYGLRTRRNLELSTLYIDFIALFCFFFIPESPKWLLTQHEDEKALAIYKNIAKWNGISNVQLTKEDIMLKQDETHKESIFIYLKNWKLCAFTFVLIMYWFSASLTFYGIGLNVGELAGNFYINNIFNALLELASVLLSALMLSYMRRKWLLVGSIGIPGLFLISFMFIPSDKRMISTVLGLAGKGFISFAYNAIYVYTGEFYPVSIKGAGMGISSFFARISGMSIPLIIAVTGIDTGMVICGCFSLAAGIFSIFLPETKNQPVLYVIADSLPKIEERDYANATLLKDADDTIENQV